jgi:hypothetical protein
MVPRALVSRFYVVSEMLSGSQPDPPSINGCSGGLKTWGMLTGEWPIIDDPERAADVADKWFGSLKSLLSDMRASPILQVAHATGQDSNGRSGSDEAIP